MRVSKRTERLIREAIVLAYYEGLTDGCMRPQSLDSARPPEDSQVVRRILRNATMFPERLLSKVDPKTEFLLPPPWLVAIEAAEREAIRKMVMGDQYTPGEGAHDRAAQGLQRPGGLDGGDEGTGPGTPGS